MTIYLLHTQNLSILEQLQLEEALLRTDQRNFFLINEGSPVAVVMGISGKYEELIDQNKVSERKIPVIKRFSGGGTVIVDENTLFTTFIGEKRLLHPHSCYPEPILRWSTEFYHTAFSLPPFDLRENDFVLGTKKCGGNAQYIQKNRWLLHTSFLFDFCPHNMQVLLHPPKTPQYRENRPHTEFLSRLSDFFLSQAALTLQIKQALLSRFHVIETTLEELKPVLARDHRRATLKIS